MARELGRAGHAVTGIDISEVQIERARRLVHPRRHHQRRLPRGIFDAVVFLYAIIHIPLAQQPVLLEHIARWLRLPRRLAPPHCRKPRLAWAGGSLARG
ncbi:MAG: class I SAM-dependent methyltransferase [Acidimicrobiia bacterium]